MKLRLLNILQCPVCGSRFNLDLMSSSVIYAGSLYARKGLPGLCRYLDICSYAQLNPKRERDCKECMVVEVTDGLLQCMGCGRVYPITNGIPRLLPKRDPSISNEKMEEEVFAKLIEHFGFEWMEFHEYRPEYLQEFLSWIYPLSLSDFRDNIVMDAGCGMGRHLCIVAHYADEVVGVDISQSIDVAKEICGERDNVHLIQADLCTLPLTRNVFDLIYSIGVIHHIPIPSKAIKEIVRVLKNGGLFHMWVYGSENNALMTKIIEPYLKKITTRLAPRGLLWLSLFLASFLDIVARLSRIGLFEALLPNSEYLKSIAAFTLRHKQNIVFDLLYAPLARYFTKDEVYGLIENAGLEIVSVSWRNKNSWRVLSRKHG